MNKTPRELALEYCKIYGLTPNFATLKAFEGGLMVGRLLEKKKKEKLKSGRAYGSSAK